LEHSRRESPQGRTVRIGLLSPYSGTNIGDQAIQVAFIANLRARFPQAELVGIYLNPRRAAALHSISTFPITGLALPFYASAAELFSSGGEPANQVSADDGPEQTTSRARQYLKRLPGLRWLVLAARKTASGVRNFVTELRWIGRSWRLVGDLDLLVVAGGGQIDDEWGGTWGQPYVLMRWALLARWRGCPFAVTSVGVGTLDRVFGRRFFAAALRRADYLSLRDQGSADAIGQLLHRPAPPVVFDIAGSLGDAERCVRAATVKTGRIALSPIAFRRAGSWPNAAHGLYETYIAKFAELAASIAAAGHEIVVFTTSGADGAAVNDMLEHLRRLAPELDARLPVVKPRTLAELMELMAECDAVVASRLHGVILAHLAERPVLALSFDRKVDVQMHQYAQEAFRLDIADFSVADASARFGRLLNESATIISTLRDARLRHGRDLQRQYDVLAALLGAQAANSAGSVGAAASSGK
jgi:polysaccharide pyruvyl transferase WcaK-like protein